MDTQLAQSLSDIQRSLGNIEGKLDSHLQAFQKHVESDKEMANDIKTLQLTAARQRGFVRAMALVGTALGSSLGWLVSHVLLKHN